MKTWHGKCSRRTLKDRHLVLTMAARATLLEDKDQALREFKKALNLTWQDHPILWYLLLQILRGYWAKAGDPQMAAAIGKIPSPEIGRTHPGDFILSPELWGAKCPSGGKEEGR